MSISQSRLKELLHYDPETGFFLWKKPRKGRVVGAVAGCVKRDARRPYDKNKAYVVIRIVGKSFYAHRLAWLYVNGNCPAIIDHIDMDGLNNSIKNLREATRSQNQWNSPIRKNNKSGYKGVSFCSRLKKWRAVIGCDKVEMTIGYFQTPELASAAYNAKAKELHGEYART
jgi:hypothetical protein